MYCGSGVTACHNLLAMEHAGLAGADCMPAPGPSGRRTRPAPLKKVLPPGKRPTPDLASKKAGGIEMTRTVWTTLLVFATAAAVGLPAQRNRDRDFGLSQEEWCRDARRSDVCEVREETLNNVRVVDLDARGNGGVAVRGWDRPDVHVRARVVVYADSDAEARQIASEIKLVTTGGRIRAEGPSRERGWWRDRGWSVVIRARGAAQRRLTVGATNGGVSVRDVRRTHGSAHGQRRPLARRRVRRHQG